MVLPVHFLLLQFLVLILLLIIVLVLSLSLSSSLLSSKSSSSSSSTIYQNCNWICKTLGSTSIAGCKTQCTFFQFSAQHHPSSSIACPHLRPCPGYHRCSCSHSCPRFLLLVLLLILILIPIQSIGEVVQIFPAPSFPISWKFRGTDWKS